MCCSLIAYSYRVAPVLLIVIELRLIAYSYRVAPVSVIVIKLLLCCLLLLSCTLLLIVIELLLYRKLLGKPSHLDYHSDVLVEKAADMIKKDWGLWNPYY